MAHVIVDTEDDRPYLPRRFDTAEEAATVRAELLAAHPDDSPWWKRLVVRKVGEDAIGEGARPLLVSACSS